MLGLGDSRGAIFVLFGDGRPFGDGAAIASGVNLRKAFGDETVQRWLAAFLWSAFGWPDLIMRERHA
ncbi:hypothetical protein LCGC14_2962590 [marine sediment metagenome]|uniref:Uncharacterized protein n=1 Tax=marine sediment metagenome TaxID=412755 RepID=A0A0F8XCM1_9ZZZZ